MYNTYNYEISKHDKNYDIRETNLHKNRKQINAIKKRCKVYQKRNCTSTYILKKRNYQISSSLQKFKETDTSIHYYYTILHFEGLIKIGRKVNHSQVIGILIGSSFTQQ